MIYRHNTLISDSGRGAVVSVLGNFRRVAAYANNPLARFLTFIYWYPARPFCFPFFPLRYLFRAAPRRPPTLHFSFCFRYYIRLEKEATESEYVKGLQRDSHTSGKIERCADRRIDLCVVSCRVKKLDSDSCSIQIEKCSTRLTLFRGFWGRWSRNWWSLFADTERKTF